MKHVKIKDLFSVDIYRPIEEVIKVDQSDEGIVREEISDYWVTDNIRDSFLQILRQYWESPNKPHEGIGIWISGFFGSGKSSFAKMLGVALENRKLLGDSASALLAVRISGNESKVLLTQIAEKIPTESVIFDISTEKGIRSGNQSITEIMYRLFLKSLGYADDLDLAELEITLEEKEELDAFRDAYEKEFNQKWDDNKDLISFSLSEASTIMHKLYGSRYATPDSWMLSAQDRTDITAGKLAERCKELMGRRRPNRNLVFVVDEVGQFVSRNVQKMLDLQGVVQSLGRISRGKVWLIVTSQEKLTELVSGLDDKRVELARLMDRFPLKVHLEPSDISEVTSKRVLSKTADAEKTLRDLYNAHSGRLIANTRLSADVKLSELSGERFMDLYPLLPYQIDLIIEVVSGLRTQGGASKHVGGANRTIIKLAQQLLIHEGVGLAEKSIGALTRIDQIYDLKSGDVPSEIRGKISAIATEVDHPMAQPVAKAICMLQYVQNIHRTAENIAATLQPSVTGDSQLSEVKQALEKLLAAHKVRLHDGQYRIPTPAEDDWETNRASIHATQADVNRGLTAVLTGLWEPKPSYNLNNAKIFKAGFSFNDRIVVEENIGFNVFFAGEGDDFAGRLQEARKRSQNENNVVFWVVSLGESVERAAVEVYRSTEMLARKERSAKTKDETALVAEEKLRMRRHEAELKMLVREAMLAGTIFFRGNDRSPDDSVDSVTKAANQVLAHVLPDVYNRFVDGAARVSEKDLESLLTNDNINGLPTVFSELKLIRDEKGKPVFSADTGPLKEVLNCIENKTSYGEIVTGKYLIDEFSREPFGWSMDAIRLFVVTLVRSGRIRATSKGDDIDSALTVAAKEAFSKNNLFKACSFQLKVAGTSINDWIIADAAFKYVFGKQIPEMQAGVVAKTIRDEITKAEQVVSDALIELRSNQFPGAAALQEASDQMMSIRNGSEDYAITSFIAGHKTIKDAIRRAAELKKVLTNPALLDLKRAKKAILTYWPFLQQEEELPEGLAERAGSLKDLLAKETFFRELAAIDQAAAAIQSEYDKRLAEAVQTRSVAYQEALERLHNQSDWPGLSTEQRSHLEQPLKSRATSSVSNSDTIPYLRAEVNACPEHYRAVVKEMMELIDGTRLVTLKIDDFFNDRVETTDQLDAALGTLKQRVEKLLAEGKKVLIQ